MSGYVKWRKREIWLAFPVDRARKLADELLPSCEWQQVMIEKALESGRIDSWCREYAEPGYETPENGILFANWNGIEDMAELAEQSGYAVEWSAEWTSCDDCGRAIRTEPDCWDWEPAFTTDSDFALTCHECSR